YPDRQVIAMAGDGGLAMLMGELLTLRTYQLPVKVVTFNNASLGMVKLEMLVDGLPDHGTDYDSVDFAAIAAAAGIHSPRVTDPGAVRAALMTAVRLRGPSRVGAGIDRTVRSIPATVTGSQVTGFAPAVGPTVRSGGVGRMVPRGRSNLRNIPRPRPNSRAA